MASNGFCEHNNIKGQYYFLNKHKFRLNTTNKEVKETKKLVFLSSNGNDDKYISYLCINRDNLKFSELVEISEKSGELVKVEERSNFLSKRLNMIFKAQKLKTFGIIVTNPRMANFSNLFEEAKSILKNNDKRHYTFIMNKVNETKLRNFPDIEAFVMISCPFSSFLECAEFKIPIFSVMELKLFEDICKIDQINIIDYQIGKEEQSEVNEKETIQETPKQNEESNMEIDIPKMQVPMINEDWVDLRRLSQEQKMQLYNQDSELVLTSFYKHYEYFRDKNWKGLDTKIEVPVQKAKLGEVGIPLSYTKIKK